MSSFPPVPPVVKGVAHFLKIAEEHEARNIVVSYWARMYACQVIMKLVPGKKPPEVSSLMIALLDWLEKTKQEHLDTEGMTNETAAQALIEQYALQLFEYADGQDRQAIFTKNVIKAFYTTGILMDILEQFGQVSEDIYNKRKYAKWKAAYIHNCLKIGDMPTPGGPDEHLKNVIDRGAEEDFEGLLEELIDLNENTDPKPDNPEDAPSTTSNSGAPEDSTDTLATPNDPPLEPGPEINPDDSSDTEIDLDNPLFRIDPPMPRRRGVTLEPELMQKAQKLVKSAASALNFDDLRTASSNLLEALKILRTAK